MSINLSKGQKITVGQSNVTVGLGWDAAQGTAQKADLDCSVFMLDSNKMLPTEANFVFYNNLRSPDGAVEHSGDNRTGEGEGDDERIKVDCSKLNPAIQELIFVATIHDDGQNFGMVRNAYIRIVDNTNGQEIAKYELDEDFSIERGVEFGRLYMKDGAWKFDATGIGYSEDLSYFVQKYYAGPVDKE